MKDTLQFLVTSIVDHPDDVQITDETDDNRTVFTIHANAEDLGKVIGRNGRIIRAIRDLIKLMAAKSGAYADVVIAE